MTLSHPRAKLLHAPPLTPLLTSLRNKPTGDINFHICRKSDQITTPFHRLRDEIQQNQKGKTVRESSATNPKIRTVSCLPRHTACCCSPSSVIRSVLRCGQSFRQRPPMSTTTANISIGIRRHRWGKEENERKGEERPLTPVKAIGTGRDRHT